MQVCFGCQHAFPSTALDRVNVSEDVAQRLDHLRALVSRVQPANSAGREAVAEMEDSLKSIVLVLRQDLDEKCAKIKKLEQQLSFLNKENEDLRGAHLDAAMANQAAQRNSHKAVRNISLVPVGPTHMLERFLSSNNMNHRGPVNAPAPPRPPAGGRSPTSARAGAAPPIMTGAKPSELVSSAIFCCIEALVVTTRAEVGVLWLRPNDSAGELLAPFIAGQSSSAIRSSAPYRISSSSLVGTVATTGIAVNLSPRPKALIAASPTSGDEHHQFSNGEGGKRGKQSFSQFLEDNHNANLLVPVFSRYGEHTRQTIGVVQLIGSTTNPFPFNDRNEHNASQASSLLSHMITSFMPTMLVEWSTRIYDHTALSSSASYSASLDQRAKDKGVDDFDPTPTLIYRSQNSERAVPKNLAQTKVFKGEVQQGATRLEASPSDALKELHRYLRSLEENWGQSVTLQTVLEKKVEQLSSQLDAARHGLHTLSKSGGLDGVGSPGRKTMASIAQGILQQNRTRAAVSTVDVEDIENDVMQRLHTSATAVFMTPDGALSTPLKRRADK